MHPVLSRSELAPDVVRLRVSAPRIASVRRPGQFVIVRCAAGAERIPLTIAEADAAEGTIDLVVQAVGKSTRDLVELHPGQEIRDVAGPLGRPTDLITKGSAICVGGGVGAAVLLSIARSLHDAGVRLTILVGARSADRVILESDLARLGEVVVCTDDGSRGRPGLVTRALESLLEERPVDAVYAAGPVLMMRAVAETTRPLAIPTTVSLNPIMVDGTGMCGGCRVTVGGRIRFACVDGPEFDAHQVDFDELRDRLTTYRKFELESLERRQSRVRERVEPPTPEPLSRKERMAIERQRMPEADPAVRASSFEEVNLGLPAHLAMLEARRCLDCETKKCVGGCPVLVDIPEFLRHAARGDFRSAAATLFRDNGLPAVTGRVCPQETQCEALCVRGRKGAPVAIGWIERCVADWARANDADVASSLPEPTGKRMAIVGSGPGGLTAAGELARAGHAVTLFEALHEAGGVLVYGIPEFRLPKSIVRAEVDRLLRYGVTLELNAIVGSTYTLSELRERFDAVFLAVGAGLPVFMDVPGESLKGVYSANEYLTRVNLMNARCFPDADTPVLRSGRVAVVGGGNVALDAARAALRLGSKEVVLVYRRGPTEMPARAEEIQHAREEGIRFEFLTAPDEIVGEKGWVTGLRCRRMTLGEADASGRARPVPVPGSEHTLPCDLVVLAVGTRANPLLASRCPELKLDPRGYIEIDESGRTSLAGVFAGGDIVRGAATVILAMGDGKRAAAAMHRFVRSHAS